MSKSKSSKLSKAAKATRTSRAAKSPKPSSGSRQKVAAKGRGVSRAAATAKAAVKATAKATVKATARAKTASPAVAISAADGPALKSFKPYKIKRGEEYMNEHQREHFKHILLGWRSQLMAEVDRTVHHLQDDAANYPDPADRATQEEEFSLELRTRDRERKLIKKIDSTIESIALDEYGYCESCGIDIGIRRLEARPTANKCVDCKTLDEIKERQLGA